MSPAEVLMFLKTQHLAVEASVAPDGRPQAAVVGIAVSDQWEIIFDTTMLTRKARNLRQNNRVALVIGGQLPHDGRTVQVEGLASEPVGADLTRVREIYFSVFPDGRDRLRWPGITHFRVKPTWLRYSDYNRNPVEIVEYTGEQLGIR